MLTYTEERFSTVHPEIAALTELHWEEVTDSPEMPLDIDWQFYIKLEDLGILKTLTVRHDGELVGYVLCMIIAAPHYKSHLFSHDDAHFLHRDHRKGTAGIRMFREAEKMLKRYNVKRVCYHQKNHMKTGKVFKYLGYKPRETIWMKDI